MSNRILSLSESYDWMRRLTIRNPLKPKQKIALAFDKLEPEEIANQLTYLEWKTLRRITVCFAFLFLPSFSLKSNKMFKLQNKHKTKTVLGLQVVCNAWQLAGHARAAALHSAVQWRLAVDPVHDTEQDDAQAACRHHTQVSRDSHSLAPPAQLQLADGRRRRHLPQRHIAPLQDQSVPLCRGSKSGHRQIVARSIIQKH